MRPRLQSISRIARRESGSAAIIVLALMAIMAVYLTSNQLTLHNLKRDLKRIEAQQLKKFQLPAQIDGKKAGRQK